jgi:hypothetical protein
MKLTDVRNSVKKNKILFFTYKKMTDPDYRAGYEAYRNKPGVKSPEEVRKEMDLIKDYWKCDPMHYFRYRLYDKDLSTEELLDYIPAYYFYNHYMASLYRDPEPVLITGSKILLSKYLKNKNIPTPRTIAVIRKGLILNDSDEQLSYNGLLRKMDTSHASVFFIKPDDGRGGAGIFTIRKTMGRFTMGKDLLEESLFSSRIRNKDFIIQEGINQRSDIKSINPTSVNTLRVITQKKGNKYRIPAVVIRIGRNRSFVDNSAQGGISVNIDVESGIMSKYAFTEHTDEVFDSHPDTGFRFEGFQLRDWDMICSSILLYASRAPEFPDVGWDIAVLEDSICVIEMNVNYGIDHLQCAIGGMRRKLDIKPK